MQRLWKHCVQWDVNAGDLGQGLAVVRPPYDTLIFNGLSGAAIAPSSGIAGISFQNNFGVNATILIVM